jgi:hypothetical protein
VRPESQLGILENRQILDLKPDSHRVIGEHLIRLRGQNFDLRLIRFEELVESEKDFRWGDFRNFSSRDRRAGVTRDWLCHFQAIAPPTTAQDQYQNWHQQHLEDFNDPLPCDRKHVTLPPTNNSLSDQWFHFYRYID